MGFFTNCQRIKRLAKLFLLFVLKVWHFRRLILDALGIDLNEELNFMSGISESNPKNYQIW
jgi:hypothetical protein